MNQQELESHLWKAADILRGSIDSGDYKHYIFGLLFFKRLSDVWAEEYDARLKEFDDIELAKDPEEHRFHIPEGCFWEDIKKRSTNIGEALNAAFRSIEDENLRLKGVFQDVDFNNKDRFPDEILEQLIQHFDAYSLRKKDVPADMLGNAYEYLIAKFADDAGARGGEFYTPKEIVRLLVGCLQPDKNMSIYDPACGSAGMLLEAIHFLDRNKKNSKSLRIFGQEKNLNTWAIAQMNLFLHDVDDAKIIRDDTLRNPRHLTDTKSKKLQQFDVVIANPPFSLKKWGYESWKNGDPFGRDIYGCPPKSYADYAFLQHMICSLKSKGKLGVVLPLGVLFREGPEKKIREGLIKSDLVEAIISLPSNVFYGADIPTCILLLNKAKPKERKKKILFVDTSKNYSKELSRNILTEDHVNKVVKAFLLGREERGYSKFITHKEISDNENILNFGLYIKDESSAFIDLENILSGTIPEQVVLDLESRFSKNVLNKIISKKSPFKFKKQYFSLGQLELDLSFLEPKELREFLELYSKYGTSLAQLNSYFASKVENIEKLVREINDGN